MVERVGEVDAGIKLRMAQDVIVYGNINREQSRILGGKMYQVVALQGIATWDAESGAIVSFCVTDILPYEPTGVRDAITELRVATGGCYDNIEDVDLFARQVREGYHP